MRREETIDLIEAEIPRLRRYARSLTFNQDDADDLVQEALTRALSKLHLWQSGTNMRAWLFTITHNVHVTALRRQQRRPRQSLEISPENPGPPQPGNQLDSLQLHEVQTAFEQLSEDHREVLHLIVIDGMSYDQAAEVIGCAVGTIRSRLSRARSALTQLLEDGAGAAARRMPPPELIARAAAGVSRAA
jgi:RNA polymerase sigma-70 factor (ECF subfamily)